LSARPKLRPVMAAPVMAIHVFCVKEDVDARDEPAHDAVMVETAGTAI